eukprot:Pgem_evm1s9933
MHFNTTLRIGYLVSSLAVIALALTSILTNNYFSRDFNKHPLNIINKSASNIPLASGTIYSGKINFGVGYYDADVLIKPNNSPPNSMFNTKELQIPSTSYYDGMWKLHNYPYPKMFFASGILLTIGFFGAAFAFVAGLLGLFTCFTKKFKYFDLIAAVCLCIGSVTLLTQVLLSPAQLGNPGFEEFCGSQAYGVGVCQVGYSYVLSILAFFSSLFGSGFAFIVIRSVSKQQSNVHAGENN